MLESGMVADESSTGGEYNPRPATISDDKQMIDYLNKWKVSSEEGIKVTFIPPGINYEEATIEEGVYFTILAMASEAHLPLPLFARRVLTFFKLAPTQLKIGS